MMTMPTPKTVSIVTLGCAKNQADTDNLARLLKSRSYDVVADPKDAGAIVVHTCSFIEAAKKQSIEAILQAGQMKTQGKKLIVSGCLVQQHGKEIFDELPEVDAFLGTGQLAQIPDILDNPRSRFIDRTKPGGFMDPDAALPRDISGPTANLRLSEGCRHPCTFCVIPRLRGGVQSRSEELILREARDLAAGGVEELMVIGQDTGDWGTDSGAPGRLPALLRSVSQIAGIRWIRLMYMHPASFTDELLDIFAEQPDKFPYLDMPLQHIDSGMLSQMKRKTDEAGIRELLIRIRRRAPQLSLRTTFIVGFPGETEAQFIRLRDFVKEDHFNYLGAFSYSQEEGTSAAGMAAQISEDVKKDRLNALTDTFYDVAHRKAQSRLGSLETVILEETEGTDVLGRTSREAPDIDAVVRMPARVARQGRFVTARLTAYDAYEFTAEPV